ncbi:hypothetical protein [Catalinimonas niigatensis]|uniref:hypothetical protein n=1 Tax=Catalinimonas niigatensis TaxID=1397264 RepID=UPI0026667BFE|nr:hypothetical protein [Catalinimonas niigatensis]WPP53281.1 hypothetical protein PZB72_12950 [Catalinimonas niigatensis]
MDTSTENVTLCAAFINDVLHVYQDKKAEYPALFSYAQEYDLSQPFDHVPIHVYNNICNWIEVNLGKVSTKRLGREIGKTVYNNLQQNKLISAQPHPHEIMEALVKVASQMIKDPKRRGWEIREKKAKSVLMRRTQTFNSTMQYGLLESLIFKSGAYSPLVKLVKSVDKGHEYDEYLISWK